MEDPCADLAVAVSVASAFRDRMVSRYLDFGRSRLAEKYVMFPR